MLEYWSRVIESIFKLRKLNLIKRVAIHLHNFRNYDGRQLTKIGCIIIVPVPPSGLFDKFYVMLIREYQVNISTYSNHTTWINVHAFLDIYYLLQFFQLI